MRLLVAMILIIETIATNCDWEMSFFEGILF